MAKKLLSQRKVFNKLKEKGLVTFNLSSFNEAIGRGQIPYHMEDGARFKSYNFKEVAKAIRVAGIGKPKVDIQAKIEDLPMPKEGESKEAYAEGMVKELGENATITDANIFKTIYSGKLEKLKYEKEQGLLIPRDEVEDKAFSVARSIRDKILSTPERMANELASMNDPHEVKELLFKEFNKMLEGFSEESFI